MEDRPLTRARQRLGEAGEALVAEYLEARGCEIVARRTRIAGCEIDLVARFGATIALVEVKTRNRSALVPGVFAVDARKRARLVRAAAVVAADRRWEADAYRLDVAVVRWDTGSVRRSPPEIDYLENAVRIGIEV